MGADPSKGKCIFASLNCHLSSPSSPCVLIIYVNQSTHLIFCSLKLHQYLSVEKPQSCGLQWCLGSKAHAVSVTLKPQTPSRPLCSKPLQLRALWPDPGPGSAIDRRCHHFLSLGLLVHKQGTWKPPWLPQGGYHQTQVSPSPRCAGQDELSRAIHMESITDVARSTCQCFPGPTVSDFRNPTPRWKRHVYLCAHRSLA